jgi:hypothetical protein
MENMNIESAQYVQYMGENSSITAVIDGVTMSVPLDPANRHYAGIVQATAITQKSCVRLRQVRW